MIFLLLFIMLFPQVVIADAGPTVESFNEESKRYNEDIGKHVNAGNTRQILEDYGKPAKESSYKESDLRGKAQTLMNTSSLRAEDQSLTEAERREAQAVSALKESQKTRKKLDDWVGFAATEKSDKITENPLIGVGSACKISGNKDEKVEIIGEPYEVEVDDIREVESEEVCFEDGVEIHKCTQILRLFCTTLSNDNHIFGSSVTMNVIESKNRDLYVGCSGKNCDYLGTALSAATGSQKITYGGWRSFHPTYNIASNHFEILISDHESFLIRNNGIPKWHGNRFLLGIENYRKISVHVSGYGNLASLSITDSHVNQVIVNGVRTTDMELQALLREGENIIEIYSGGKLKFIGSKRACTSWQETWEEACE
jgi:hypothetical protein